MEDLLSSGMVQLTVVSEADWTAFIPVTIGLLLWAEMGKNKASENRKTGKKRLISIYCIMRHFLWFDKIECLFYVMYMFVSAVIDPGGIDSARLLTQILTQYGFQKVQRACWENGNMSERDINDLKKDIDRVTDYYDSIRMYQYPVQGMLAITEMMKKQWKRSLLRPPASEMQQPPMQPPMGGMMPPMSGFPGMYG